MLALGIQGSPRKNGNTAYLLSAFLDEAARLGARTQTIEVAEGNIIPCREYTACEKKGYCPINDDMAATGYALLREAEVVVAASPIFFYNMTAQIKVFVDRCQALWARKYKLHLKDPAESMRRGFLLSVGATKGKNLFQPIELSMYYFFDAINARYSGALTYRGIEKIGDMARHPTVKKDVAAATQNLLKLHLGRKKILFISPQNVCLSQMAHAFVQHLGGKKIDAACADSNPVAAIDTDMVIAMAEKKLDMAFRKPHLLTDVLAAQPPELVISIGNKPPPPLPSDVALRKWELPKIAEKGMDTMRRFRDAIELKSAALIIEFDSP